MKNIFRIKILVNRIKVMMIKVICKFILRIGILLDVLGRKDGMRSKKIVIVRSMVVIKLIFFLFFIGIKKFGRVRNISIMLGMVR